MEELHDFPRVIVISLCSSSLGLSGSKTQLFTHQDTLFF